MQEIESFSLIQPYEKGAVIFQNNEPARNLYGLVEGSVELSLLFKEEIITKDIKYESYITTHVETLEKPVVIDTIEKGEMFGWSAMVEPEKMTATATCTADAKVILIPSNYLKKILGADHELGSLLFSRISTLISNRLNSRTDKLVDTWCNLFETAHISPQN